MEELCDAITNQCGLAVERQLLRHNDVDLEIHLDKKLDVYYGLDDNARIYVYNKGGFFTNDSPLKKARTVDMMSMNETMETGETGNSGRFSFSGRQSFNNSNGNSNNKSKSKTSFSGLKSAMADSDGRDSIGGGGGRESFGEKKKGNVSFKR